MPSQDDQDLLNIMPTSEIHEMLQKHMEEQIDRLSKLIPEEEIDKDDPFGLIKKIESTKS